MTSSVTVVVDGREFKVVLNEHGKAYFPGAPALRDSMGKLILGERAVCPVDATVPKALVGEIERKASEALREAALSNALVMQKNAILHALTNNQFDQGMQMLSFVWRVWDASDYSYKTDEMIRAAKDVAASYEEGCDCRKEMEFKVFALEADRKVFYDRGF